MASQSVLNYSPGPISSQLPILSLGSEKDNKVDSGDTISEDMILFLKRLPITGWYLFCVVLQLVSYVLISSSVLRAPLSGVVLSLLFLIHYGSPRLNLKLLEVNQSLGIGERLYPSL